MAKTVQALVLGGYTGASWFRRHRKLCLALLTFFCIFYGFAFTILYQVFLLQLAAPVVAGTLFLVWLLPDRRNISTRPLEILLFTFLFVLLVWPDYLAVALPGLPWITALRLTSIPLLLVFAISYSSSADIRAQMKGIYNGIPLPFKLFAAFVAIQFLSIGLSAELNSSLNKFINAQLGWTAIWLIACLVFLKPARIGQLASLIWACVLINGFIGLWEQRLGAVPWAGHVPSFLAVGDESVQRILRGASRAAVGTHRVQAKFSTPLGLGEFMALATPFIAYFVFYGRNLAVRALAVATLVLMMMNVRAADSRLGTIGMSLGLMLFVALWAFERWRTRRESLIAPAIILTYPAIFALLVASSFFVRRIRNFMWGSGAQAASDAGRQEQLTKGIAKLAERPWGYGIGRSAEVLGVRNPEGVLTIDNYYVATWLDYGIIGFALYFSMFYYVIYRAIRLYPSLVDNQRKMAGVIIISLTLFVIEKWSFNQQDTHPLVFAMFGAIIAIISINTPSAQKA
ncbi:MAG: O-antigen ligase family protein [Sphingomonas sp.]|jgi:hypothetical protein